MGALILTVPCSSGCDVGGGGATATRRGSSNVWSPAGIITMSSLSIRAKRGVVRPSILPRADGARVYRGASFADDQRLYPGELAAVSRLMAHQLRYDKRIHDGIRDGVLDEVRDKGFHITGDVSAIVINLTAAGVRVLQATLLYDSWAPVPQDVLGAKEVASKKPRIVFRLLEELGLDDEFAVLRVRQWLFFLASHKPPTQTTQEDGGSTTTRSRKGNSSSDDSGYGSGTVAEQAVCGSDCRGC
ncbi:hypothetical protein CONLIGDRAFT_142234 [Coniochaeta ligniaria NRRL 30616]|uniref:Uncharacterized protein n=1 Tax=Coniochaeta ligniaria NRRL 30616 TaxID=1408157 RepID=A0A1J7I7C3_9PEZI|nr:hypothetical protein CONLIGDRAFT_142234 [Coniochaeta ligniaria NRRL 30616]